MNYSIYYFLLYIKLDNPSAFASPKAKSIAPKTDPNGEIK